MKRMFARRQALRVLAAGGSSALVVGRYTWRVEPHWLEFTYRPLPIASLPPELEGHTLAQISDLHVGPRVDDGYLIDSFQRVQELGPDFVAVTGDWISYFSPRQFEQLRRVLAHLPHGRLGTVGILGNHDYGFHWEMPEVAEQVTGIAHAAGVALRCSATRGAVLRAYNSSDSTTFGDRVLTLRGYSPREPETLPRWCSPTTLTPRIGQFRVRTRAGSLLGIRMEASASHHSCRHRCCRCVYTVCEPPHVYQPRGGALATGPLQCASRNSDFSA
jgi:hypothetical protein